MLEDILTLLVVAITAVAVLFTAIYIFGTVACYKAGEAYKTVTEFGFDKCYVMNADGDFIPEEVYIEQLKYGE